MTANPVASFVLGDGPCGMMPVQTSGRRRSPIPARHRDIGFGASSLHVPRDSAFIVGANAAVAFNPTVDAVLPNAGEAANSEPGVSRPAAAAELKSACQTRTAPIGFRRGRSGPKIRARATGCVGIQAAPRRISQRCFALDNYDYRAQSCQPADFAVRRERKPDRWKLQPHENARILRARARPFGSRPSDPGSAAAANFAHDYWTIAHENRFAGRRIRQVRGPGSPFSPPASYLIGRQGAMSRRRSLLPAPVQSRSCRRASWAAPLRFASSRSP